jgi:putative drug exporter of the RND superfamily
MTLGAWVLALVLGIGTIVALLDLTSEGELTSNPESERGYEAIGRHLPPDPNEEYVNELILIRSGTSTVDDPAFRNKVGALFAEVESSGVTNNAESFYESRDASLVSADRSATLIPVGLRGDCEAGASTLAGIVEAAAGGGFEVFLSGECSADNDLNKILDEDLKTGELYFGLPAALIILVLVFGTLVAAIVPLLVAFFSIGVALGLAAIFSQGFDLSVFLFQMTTVMGLAIAADYGLFIVSRYREERAAAAASSTRSQARARPPIAQCSSADWRSCSRCLGSCSFPIRSSAASASAHSPSGWSRSSRRSRWCRRCSGFWAIA